MSILKVLTKIRLNLTRTFSSLPYKPYKPRHIRFTEVEHFWDKIENGAVQEERRKQCRRIMKEIEETKIEIEEMNKFPGVPDPSK